jgi:pimeloyl-ACP methyl ester carboxylesterase
MLSETQEDDVSIYFERRGSGEPLLLLHGTGSFCRVWDRVVPLLAEQAQTIAVDLPGFGRSPSPAFAPRSMTLLVDAIEAFMDAHELSRPHVVGNSGGGWMALELAKRGRARSVVALGPMGLWHGNSSPLYARLNFYASYRAAGALRRWHEPILRSRLGRAALMSQVMGRPWALTYEEALATVNNFLDSPGIMAMAEAVANGRFAGGRLIDVPVTVAYGRRDAALLPHHRRREELPPQTRWFSMPRCGHVPMADDPELVAGVILSGTVAAVAGQAPAGALQAA